MRRQNSQYLRDSWSTFFTGLSDAPKYDIILAEKSDMIDSFIPVILTFKACPTRIKHVKDTLWTLFERLYLLEEAVNQIFVFSLNIVILWDGKYVNKKTPPLKVLLRAFTI